MPEVVFRRGTIPIPATPPDAPGGLCLYLAPEWLPIVLGFLGALSYRGLWQGDRDQQDDAVREVSLLLSLLRECEPTETPECPEPSPEQHGWTCEAGGVTGLSIVELEEMLAMLQITGHWDENGVLWLSLDCCHFMPIGKAPAGWKPPEIYNVAGLGNLPPALNAVPSPSDIADPTSSFYDNPNIASYGSFGRERKPLPTLATKDLTRCAKATAIVNVNYNVIYKLTDTLQDQAEFFSPAGDILTGGGALLGLIGVAMGAVGIGIGAYIAAAKGGIDLLVNFRDEVLTEANRAALICKLTSIMSDADDFTNADIASAMYEIWHVNYSGWANALTTLRQLNVQEILDEAREEMQAARCGCFAVTNPGELPPVAAACVRWNFQEFADNRDIAGRAAFEAGMMPRFGQSIGDKTYKSTWRDKFGGFYERTALGILVKFDKPVKLHKVAFNYAHSGGGASGGGFIVAAAWDAAASVWKEQNLGVNYSPISTVASGALDQTMITAKVLSQYYIIAAQAEAAQSQPSRYITLSQIKLTVETADGIILDAVPENVVICQ